jgi:thiol:disulfide interchange protein DsbA
MGYVNKIPGKITVVEFFWYGCSHCNDLQPYVRDWLKEKDGGVQVIRIPAVFNPQWGVGASFFYSVHESGLFSEELHEKTFDAVHKSKSLNLSDTQSVKSFLAGNGVSFGDVQKISDLMKSQKVAKRVEAAAKASNEYMIPGTPAMVIENKYLMTATEAEGTKNLVNEVKNVVKALRLCKK